jgi:hypothetical protein
LPARDLLLGPLQVQHVGREGLDEVVLRHAALVDHDLADLALVAAHVVDLERRMSHSFSIVLTVKRIVIRSR